VIGLEAVDLVAAVVVGLALPLCVERYDYGVVYIIEGVGLHSSPLGPDPADLVELVEAPPLPVAGDGLLLDLNGALVFVEVDSLDLWDEEEEEAAGEEEQKQEVLEPLPLESRFLGVHHVD